MENLQIHSRSYIVRWVHVAEEHSITWSVQPLKKSINFGIFKHPGKKNDLTTPTLPTSATFDTPDTPTTTNGDGERNEKSKRRGSVAKHDGASIIEKLRNLGLKCVEWVGNCEADKVSMGTYDIPPGQEGTYGLVFDNTFSKTVAKSATFVLMTHPTNAPPKNKALVTPYQQAPTASGNASVGGPKGPQSRPGSPAESLNQDSTSQAAAEPKPSTRSRRHTLSTRSRGSTLPKSLPVGDVHTGILWKRRRKKGQGWAKRYFSLDFTSSTLSYYQNQHSSALNGAIPLSLAAVGADEGTREFSIDSGAEVWHLRATNMDDFEQWRQALEKASEASIVTPSPGTPAGIHATSPFAPPAIEAVLSREWEMAEGLLSRVSGSRDAVRRLAQDTEPKQESNAQSAQSSKPASPSASSIESQSSPFFVDTDENPSGGLPFWKRKASTASNQQPQGLFKRKASGQQLTVPGTPPALPAPAPGTLNAPKIRPGTAKAQVPIEHVHDRCMAILRDLDAVVTDFSALLNETRTRRKPALQHSDSRMSIDSVASDEFFDAEDSFHMDPRRKSQLLNLRRSSDQLNQPAEEEFKDMNSEAGDSESSSDAGESNPTSPIAGASAPSLAVSTLFPTKARSLSSTNAPQKVQYRTSVQPPKQPPPSLIGFLRKNAGKDLSSVSMPVTANEPVSALQRLAEPLESASLLHAAASLSESDKAAERLLYVAAFAVTNFSSNRVKERALRKPFNPMLGETYELVRSDLGFRFVSEKVVHRPVRLAWQADALDGKWSLSQSAQPIQKFWGKSAELNTEGRIRLVLHDIGQTGERYSWVLAPAFLRNILAGEKYIEPTATMTILNETTGMKAVATFKAGSLFSGRSEDVTVSLHEPGSASTLPLSLTGKWTTSLARADSNAIIWEAGPLVDNAAKNWGFTTFAAALNQLSPNDKMVLPPTDSRLRPDQRALEDGNLDEAEALKARLEERQRARRKVLETHGTDWQPRFFDKVETEGDTLGDEEVWSLKVGKEGYWECRERNSWEGVSRVFEV